MANRLKKAAGFHLVDADRPILIGLTGGTGAGKTSALAALEDLGGTVLDCDAVYHEMLRTDPAPPGAIERVFGPVFGPDGPWTGRSWGTSCFLRPRRAGPAERHRVRIPAAGADAPGGGTGSLVGLDAINLVESGLGEAVRLHRGGAGPGGGPGPPHHGSGTAYPETMPGCVFSPAVRQLLPGALHHVLENQEERRTGAVPGEGGDFFPGSAAAAPPYQKEDMNNDR